MCCRTLPILSEEPSDSDSPYLKRRKVKSKLRRKSVLDDTGSEESRPCSPFDPSTSPSRKSLHVSRNPKFHAVWTTLKRLAPARIRRSGRRKNNLKDTGRLSSSHPDVSHSNLATLTKRSRDDSYSADMVDALSDVPPHRSTTDTAETKASGSSSGSTPLRIPLMESALARQHIAQLRQHPFYQLDVHLRCGRDFPAKDACGTSDPYVKIKAGNRQLYRSRTIPRCLDPVWDEYFCLPIDDVFQPLAFRVYDHDFVSRDDFIGVANLDLTQLDFDRATDFVLQLTDTEGSDNCGTLHLTVTLTPKTQEDKEQYYGKGSSRSGETSKKQKVQLWDNVVTIVLVEGKDLLPMDENGLSDPYVKFRLGNEKYKSKYCSKTLNPQWLEQFDLHLYGGGGDGGGVSQVLEVSVWDHDFHGKDDFMGRAQVDLAALKHETTHRLWLDLKDGGSGSIFLLLTISGTMHGGGEAVTDLSTYEINLAHTRAALARRYALKRSFNDFEDVGHLTVIVYRAVGLAAADLCGKSDPFCVLELTNARLQTHTEYRTLSPEWNKVFTFQVKDIHAVLEVTVFDEDRDKKFEFLGKVVIPLLKIKNNEKKWYVLKDKTLRTASKGQILLQMELIYNPIKSWIRTFDPKETKYMQPEQKFKRIVFMRNVNRVKTLAMDFVDLAKFFNSCIQWESKVRSITAFIVFVVLTYTFEVYMIPFAFLLLFVKNFVIWTVLGSRDEWETLNEEEEDDDDEKEVKEEKKSLKERLQAVQDVTAMVQNILGEIASFGERIKNTFNFTQGYLSWLAIALLVIGTVILYYIPLRYLILAWGINKFTKKLRCGDTVSNNELLDFLSRVPDNEEKLNALEGRDFSKMAAKKR